MKFLKTSATPIFKASILKDYVNMHKYFLCASSHELYTIPKSTPTNTNITKMSKPTELRSAKHQYYIKLRMKELQQKIEDLEASYDDLARYCLYLEYQQQANNLNIQHAEATFREADRMRITGTSTMTDHFGEREARIFEQANNRYHLWKEAESVESGTASKIRRAYRGLDDLECDLAAIRIELVELETVLKELERTDVMDIDG